MNMNRILVSLGSIALFAALSYGSNIKTNKIETKILELPNVSLQTINYNGLTAGYALSKISVVSTAKQSEEAICQNSLTNKLVKVPAEFFNVTHTVPAIIIVVKDKQGKVVYAEKIGNQKFNNEEVTENTPYGKGDCRFHQPGVLEQTFEREKGEFLAKIEEEALKDTKKDVADIVKRSLYAKYADEKFKMSYVDDKSGAYKDLSDAYETAVTVYKNYKANGYSPEIVAPLKTAIAAWEKALTESNLSDKKARINYDITLKLHENLAVAYMYTNDYETAIVHFGKIASLQKASFPDFSDANYAKVKDRAVARVGGVTANRAILESADKIKTAIADADRYRSQLVVADMQKEFSILEKQYTDYKASQGASNSSFVEGAEKKAIASGKLNPYESKIANSMVQGNYFQVSSFFGGAVEEYTEVPVLLCEIQQLNELIITGNKVAKVPPEIAKLKMLKVLNLKDNKLTELPEELSKVESLKKIDVSGNQISKLPSEIGQLKNLKELNIKGNPVSADEVARVKAALPKCKVKI
jgi:tetratricopeptide (TPR) repeat protein